MVSMWHHLVVWKVIFICIILVHSCLLQRFSLTVVCCCDILHFFSNNINMLVCPDEYSVVAVTTFGNMRGFLYWIHEQTSDCKQQRRWRCELCFLTETWRRRTRSPCSSPAPSRSSCCAPTSRSAWRTCRGAAEGPTLNTASTTSPRVGHSTATLAACSGETHATT